MIARPFASTPRHEAHLSAQRTQAQTHPWVPCPHGDTLGTTSAAAQAREGQKAPDALTGSGFPRHHRLLRPQEFENVLRRRDVFINAPPLHIVAVRSGLGVPRLGLVIGKRVAPRAVDRNRMRRIVRESFRLHAAELAAFDIVVMQRQRLAVDQLPPIRALLEQAWQRLQKQSLT